MRSLPAPLARPTRDSGPDGGRVGSPATGRALALAWIVFGLLTVPSVAAQEPLGDPAAVAAVVAAMEADSWAGRAELAEELVEDILVEVDVSRRDLRLILQCAAPDCEDLPPWFSRLSAGERRLVRALVQALAVAQESSRYLAGRADEVSARLTAAGAAVDDRLPGIEAELDEVARLLDAAAAAQRANLAEATAALAGVSRTVAAYRSIIDEQNEALQRGGAIEPPALLLSLSAGYQFPADAGGFLVPGVQVQLLFRHFGLGIGAMVPRTYDDTIVVLSATVPVWTGD